MGFGFDIEVELRMERWPWEFAMRVDDNRGALLRLMAAEEFLQQAPRVRGSVGGWLHSVATRRSIDAVRRNSARPRREAAYTAGREAPEVQAWSELEPVVDAALEALSEDERSVLVGHYLERQTTVEMSRRLGVSQPTVSRRSAGALES